MEAKDEARSNCVCQDLLLMRREHVYGMAVRDLRWAVNFETLRMSGDIMIDSMREMGIDKMPTRDNSSSKTYMTEYLQVRWRYQRDKRARGQKQKLPIPSFQTLDYHNQSSIALAASRAPRAGCGSGRWLTRNGKSSRGCRRCCTHERTHIACS